MKHLKKFLILHRFYAHLLKESGLTDLSYEEVLNKVEDYEVLGQCQCEDKSCATVYMKADRDFTEELCEMFSYDKAFMVLHHKEDKSIEIEALESFDYPYVKEFTAVFENNNILEYDSSEAQDKVDGFFKDLVNEKVQTIFID